jgi:hypothetical protein
VVLLDPGFNGMHGSFIALIMEAVCTSETSMYFGKTKQCYTQKAVILITAAIRI